MTTHKILVADPISPKGVEALRAEPSFEVVFQTGLKEDALLEIIPDCSALIVRSETKVNRRVLAAAAQLRVVGRAGVGVDNVDVEAATARGVVVMNTPDGNTISTAEHAFSLLVSTARLIPQADASMKAARWDRKKFQGVELYGKTLGILGMGPHWFRTGPPGHCLRHARARLRPVSGFQPGARPYRSNSSKSSTTSCPSWISSPCTCR